MGLLKKAINEQAYLKCGTYGEAGSGKTTTSSYLAIAISQQLGNKKPVGFFETEAGSDFLIKRFEEEGVELLRVKSHSLSDLIESAKEAEQSCSILIVDSISHVWANLLESKLKAVNQARKAKNWDLIDNLEFQHYNDVKREWAKWTTFFLNSKMHIIVCGRAGDIWEHVTNEKGKKELQKGGTKMKAEKEFGYEPSLSIEMQRVSRGTKPGSGWIHRATVLKDRSDTINGRSFDFDKPKAGYKKGDWKGVYKAFEPAILALNLGATHNTIDESRTSQDLFAGSDGESTGSDNQRKRKIALEEIEGTLRALWPGQDVAGKTYRQALTEALFNTRSWTAVESKQLTELEPALKLLRRFEDKVTLGLELQNPSEIKGILVDIQIEDTEPLPDAVENDKALWAGDVSA